MTEKSNYRKESILTGPQVNHSLPCCDLSRCSKQDILEYFENSYSLYETLFTALKDTSVFYKSPDYLRLPLIFYYGHTATLYVNKLKLAGLIKDRIDLHLETLLETGVDEMSWDDTESYRFGGKFQWPTVEEVYAYRLQLRKLIREVIRKTPLVLPITEDSPWGIYLSVRLNISILLILTMSWLEYNNLSKWALFLSIEHERLHFETSSVLFRQLPVDMLAKPNDWHYASYQANENAGDNNLIAVDQKDVRLGRPDAFPSFGWDNEYGELLSHVSPFQATKYPITNGEYLKFVKDGGYERREFWSNEGWNWKIFRKAHHPVFWICDKGCKSGCGGNLSEYSHCQPRFFDNDFNYHNQEDLTSKFKYRTTFDVITMPMEWPVEVNYHEAKAYCTWLGKDYRLPSEAEYHRMLDQNLPPNPSVAYDVAFDKVPDWNLNFQYCSSTFGSWATTGESASQFFRLAFRRHFFQHAGFRVVKSNPRTLPPIVLLDTEISQQCHEEYTKYYSDNRIEICGQISSNVQFKFETDQMLYDMLRFQYSDTDNIHSLYGVMTEILVEKMLLIPKTYGIATDSALVIGCGTGRLAFELSTIYRKVLGLDYCGKFISACLNIAKKGSANFDFAGLNDSLTISIDSNINLDRVAFKQLSWLPNEVGNHDLVLLTCLDRVNNRKSWLIRLNEIVKDDGIVVINISDVNSEQLMDSMKDEFDLLACVNLIDNKKIANGNSIALSNPLLGNYITIWKKVPIS
ncbi:Ergothioneine biosynthesis protein 1 [Trichoplax sp. H2]|nr:Ergothioneine biosynthesis protein 1 [Trichoplax sp. H2]|eukprot:RDD47836.1 Ergothioneine biosynthesis protein 1 [Trichoplax sp. H2]